MWVSRIIDAADHTINRTLSVALLVFTPEIPRLKVQH